MYCTPLCSFTRISSTSFRGGGGPARSASGATTDTLRSGWLGLFIFALNIQRRAAEAGWAGAGSGLPAGGDSALSPPVSARQERGTAVIRAMQMRRERGDRGAPGERGCLRPSSAGERPAAGPGAVARSSQSRRRTWSHTASTLAAGGHRTAASRPAPAPGRSPSLPRDHWRQFQPKPVRRGLVLPRAALRVLLCQAHTPGRAAWNCP